MHHLQAIDQVSGAGGIATVFLVAVVLLGAARARAAVPNQHLWDESGKLSPRQRAHLDRRLGAATVRVGSPVFVLLTDKLGHETVADVAARAFAERSLGGNPESNPVLLVVSIRDGVAAIETGKGNAGIVPEIDAQRITRDIARALSHGAANTAIERALAEIVESVEETKLRRRPSPPENDPFPAAGPGPSDNPDPHPDAGPGAPPDAGNDAGVGAGPPASGANPPTKPRGGSRLPWAAGIAILLLLGLALRRRRHIETSRASQSPASHASQRGATKTGSEQSNSPHPTSPPKAPTP